MCREDFRPYYAVSLFTGMRTGEIRWPQWRAWIWNAALILVRETKWSMVRLCKADRFARDIHMSQPVYSAFAAARACTFGQNFGCLAVATIPICFNNVTQACLVSVVALFGEELERRPYQTRHG